MLAKNYSRSIQQMTYTKNIDPLAIAETIANGFDQYRDIFQTITMSAKQHFENRHWSAAQKDSSRRLAIYAEYRDGVVQEIVGLTKNQSFSHETWIQIKAEYREFINARHLAELYETFFNSVHREITNDGPVDDKEMFVTSEFPSPPVTDARQIINQYVSDSMALSLATILEDLNFEQPWDNLDRDIEKVIAALTENWVEANKQGDFEILILKSIFYRNKGAYVVGQIKKRSANTHQDAWPFVLPILINNEGRLYIDTLISHEDDLSIVFSFTRTYFMVHTDYPYEVVDFLQILLPRKTRSDLYASLGLHKHGKTVFYRDFLDHLDRTSDKFIIAPGIRGMVMTVFTLPSLQTVFKVIKDEFPPQKDITTEQVKNKYHVVKRHDRVGRMADTQEFENLVFPRDRFSKDLEDELLRVAPSSVEISSDKVLIKHLYTERLMTPLNLYIETADEAELREALDEYGNAIKQLAAANIFPGDMLLKNFGITRHRRVVFYDYDEISYLTDINFRAIPHPRTPEEEFSADTWYTVDKMDVFPEEFRHFLFGKKEIKQLFTQMHGELFDPEYWQKLQDHIVRGQVMDVFPYRRAKRFSPQYIAIDPR